MTIVPVDIESRLNPKHQEFFRDNHRELLFYGGAGAGKSYSVADKLLINSVRWRVPVKSLVIRRTLPSSRRTCIPLIEQRAETLSIPYKLNKSSFIADIQWGNKPNQKSTIEYLSMNNPADYEKIKSITDVDFIWIEEANEITEDAYDKIRLRLRGGKGGLSQLVCTFNPISTMSWLHSRFWESGKWEKIRKIVTNVYQNPFILKSDPEYVADLEDLKNTNLNLYKVYCLGEWGRLLGSIYQNFEIIDKLPEKIDEIIYGLDFGFNNPNALVKVYVSDMNFYFEQMIYKTGLTNTELIAEMDRLDIEKTNNMYCDSSEPDRIKEIHGAGYNIRGGKKDVLPGIDYCMSQKLNVHSDSNDMIKEFSSYCWKEDKDGKPLDEPVKYNDHLMDAMRYAIYTHFGHGAKVAPPSPKKQHKRRKGRSKVQDLPT